MDSLKGEAAVRDRGEASGACMGCEGGGDGIRENALGSMRSYGSSMSGKRGGSRSLRRALRERWRREDDVRTQRRPRLDGVDSVGLKGGVEDGTARVESLRVERDREAAAAAEGSYRYGVLQVTSARSWVELATSERRATRAR